MEQRNLSDAVLINDMAAKAWDISFRYFYELDNDRGNKKYNRQHCL